MHSFLSWAFGNICSERWREKQKQPYKKWRMGYRWPGVAHACLCVCVSECACVRRARLRQGNVNDQQIDMINILHNWFASVVTVVAKWPNHILWTRLAYETCCVKCIIQQQQQQHATSDRARCFVLQFQGLCAKKIHFQMNTCAFIWIFICDSSRKILSSTIPSLR